MNYSYKEIDGICKLYENDKVITTPKGIELTTEDSGLAEALVDALKDGEDYTNPRSLLAYQYVYCDLQADSEEAQSSRKYNVEWCRDNLDYDMYLMFRQTAPARTIVAEYFRGNMVKEIEGLSLRQLVAYIVFSNCFQSLMLPFYIVKDVLPSLLQDEDKGYDEIVKFCEDVVAFEEENGLNESNIEYLAYSIHAFCLFYTNGLRTY